MSFAAAAQTLLDAALTDVAVVTDAPHPTDGATFDDTTARIGSVVYVYDGADPAAGPFRTSTLPTLYAACYGTSQAAAHLLGTQVRAALPYATALNDYRFRCMGVQAPVQDLGYNPPEWYSLVRFVGIGLYGED